MRRKYEKQNRLTASVRLASRDYDAAHNTVKPTLEANGGPKVKITATGGKISKGKLKQYVPVFDEQTVNRDLLVQGAGNLHDYFQSIGYFDAQVDFKIDDAGPDEEDITYVLELGPRHKLVSVAIQGNRYFRTQDIRERMFMQPSGFIRLRRGRYSEGFLSRDKEAIESLYMANGFRDVKVTAASVDDYKGKTGNVAVTVTIDEGAQYSVSALTLKGTQELDKDNIEGNLASAPGQPFSQNNVALDRDYILRTYQAAGFPDASFNWKMKPVSGSHQVELQYLVTEGNREFVRDLLVTGLTHTRRSRVDPALHLHAGDPLSWVEMGSIQRNLYELGVFDTVDMAIQNPDGDTREKYVVYHLEEGHRYSVAVGAGAEIAQIGGSQYSLDNPQGQTGFSPRGSLDVSRLDMFGLGQSLNFKSRFSSLDDLASINYLIPRFKNVQGRDISITAIYDNERDVRTFAERRLEADLQLSQKLSKPTTVFWRYSYRDTKISTLKIDPLLIPLYSQPALIGELSANLIQDRRDNPADAHRGIYNTVDIGLSSHIFGSRQNFGKILLRNSYYHPLRGGLVLASNTEFGWIAPFGVPSGEDAGAFVPLPERFFSGGGTSERGFPDAPGWTTRSGDGISYRRQCFAIPFDGAPFSAHRRQHSRRAVSRHGQCVLHPRRRLVSRAPERSDGLRLHEPRGRLRHTLPDAGRARACGSGLQHQPADVQRPAGNLRSTAFRRSHQGTAERQPFPILLFHRAGLLMMRTALPAMLLAVLAHAAVLDRIAVTAGKDVITESEVIEEIRVTDF